MYSCKSLTRLVEIQIGLMRDEFELFYQPIISLKSNKAVGFEALVRWNHPNLGLVMPVDFVPFIEKYDWLACMFSRYVIQKVAEQACTWKDNHSFYLAVNIPTAHISQSNFSQYFETILRTYSLSNSDIVIELTESVYGDFPSIIQNLAILKQNKSDVVLDDFLTGFSSFEKLLRLGGYLSGVKVSQLFAVNLIENLDIVSLLTKVAHTRNLSVTAEGIESEAQLKSIKSIGVDNAQGWLWCPAVKSNDALTWAVDYNTKP